MHLFVTGATGFLGTHFVAAALADGHQVTALRRLGSKPRIPLAQEPNWLDGDLSDDWSEQLQLCDALIHLAAAGVSSEKENWEHCFDINVRRSLQLWRLAVDNGVKRILVCGSCFEYGLSSMAYDYIPADAPLMPTDAYSSSKAAATMAALGLAREFHLQLLIARTFHIFGEGEAGTRFWPSLVCAAKAGEDFPMSKGEQVRDFMHVSIAAQSLLKLTVELELLCPGGKILNVGTGRPQSLFDFALEQWSALNAKGFLLPGHLPYRPNEIMRCVPLV